MDLLGSIQNISSSGLDFVRSSASLPSSARAEGTDQKSAADSEHSPEAQECANSCRSRTHSEETARGGLGQQDEEKAAAPTLPGASVPRQIAEYESENESLRQHIERARKASDQQNRAALSTAGAAQKARTEYVEVLQQWTLHRTSMEEGAARHEQHLEEIAGELARLRRSGEGLPVRGHASLLPKALRDDPEFAVQIAARVGHACELQQRAIEQASGQARHLHKLAFCKNRFEAVIDSLLRVIEVRDEQIARQKELLERAAPCLEFHERLLRQQRREVESAPSGPPPEPAPETRPKARPSKKPTAKRSPPKKAAAPRPKSAAAKPRAATRENSAPSGSTARPLPSVPESRVAAARTRRPLSSVSGRTRDRSLGGGRGGATHAVSSGSAAPPKK